MSDRRFSVCAEAPGLALTDDPNLAEHLSGRVCLVCLSPSAADTIVKLLHSGSRSQEARRCRHGEKAGETKPDCVCANRDAARAQTESWQLKTLETETAMRVL